MMTDPIADFLIRIKNGYMAHRKSVDVSHSKINLEIAKVLNKKGFIESIKTEKDGTKSFLTLQLVYQGDKPKLTDLARISKPGRRVYAKKGSIPRVLGGLGFIILSTPFGVLTDADARKKGVGGELLCKLW